VAVATSYFGMWRKIAEAVRIPCFEGFVVEFVLTSAVHVQCVAVRCSVLQCVAVVCGFIIAFVLASAIDMVCVFTCIVHRALFCRIHRTLVIMNGAMGWLR